MPTFEIVKNPQPGDYEILQYMGLFEFAETPTISLGVIYVINQNSSSRIPSVSLFKILSLQTSENDHYLHISKNPHKATILLPPKPTQLNIPIYQEIPSMFWQLAWLNLPVSVKDGPIQANMKDLIEA